MCPFICYYLAFHFPFCLFRNQRNSLVVTKVRKLWQEMREVDSAKMEEIKPGPECIKVSKLPPGTTEG